VEAKAEAIFRRKAKSGAGSVNVICYIPIPFFAILLSGRSSPPKNCGFFYSASSGLWRR